MISVIVSILNEEDNLPGFLDNIRQQSGADFELILIEGGSSDRTLEILAMNRSIIDHLEIVPRASLYQALNRGIDLASGEWLYFMGCDDFLATDTILADVARLLDEKKHDYGVGIVHQFPSGRIFPPRPSTQWLFHSLHHQATFYHRRIFQKFRYNETLNIAADYELTLRVYLADYRLKILNQSIAYFNESGTSGRNRQLAWNECIGIRKRVYGPVVGVILNVLVRFLLKIKDHLNTYRRRTFSKPVGNSPLFQE